MIRQTILYIAYSACKGGGLLWKQNPFQYNSAVNLIVINFLIHVCQLIALIMKIFPLSIKSFDLTHYFLIIGVFVLCAFLFKKIFSKKVLTHAKEIYEDSNIEKYSRLIAFGYLAINILLLSFAISIN